KSERYKAFATAFNKLASHILSNRLYLPNRLHEVISAFLDPLRQVASDFNLSNQQHESGQTAGVDYWVKADSAFREPIMPSYEKLCHEIQDFIGMDSQHDTAASDRTVKSSVGDMEAKHAGDGDAEMGGDDGEASGKRTA